MLSNRAILERAKKLAGERGVPAYCIHNGLVYTLTRTTRWRAFYEPAFGLRGGVADAGHWELVQGVRK